MIPIRPSLAFDPTASATELNALMMPLFQTFVITQLIGSANNFLTPDQIRPMTSTPARIFGARCFSK